MEFGIQNEPWVLKLSFSGFKVLNDKETNHGKGRMIQAMNEGNGLTLSIFFEKEKMSKTPDECRTFYWRQAQKSPVPKEEIKQLDLNAMRLVEWKVNEFRGMAINQKNVMGFLSQESYCIVVHLSKAAFKKEEQKLFNRFLSEVQILESVEN